MTRFGHVMRLTAACALSVCVGALFLVAPPSAQGKELASAPTAPAGADKQDGADKKVHRLVLQVNTNDPAMMTLALNNATNVEQYYKNVGEKVEIAIVTFGPGLHMLRDDTSPVKARLESFKQGMPNVSFMACENTLATMTKTEGKEPPLVPNAQRVPAGIVTLIELSEKGWTIVRP